MTRQQTRRLLFAAMFRSTHDPANPFHGQPRRARRLAAREHANRFWRENREKLR